LDKQVVQVIEASLFSPTQIIAGTHPRGPLWIDTPAINRYTVKFLSAHHLHVFALCICCELFTSNGSLCQCPRYVIRYRDIENIVSMSCHFYSPSLLSALYTASEPAHVVYPGIQLYIGLLCLYG